MDQSNSLSGSDDRPPVWKLVLALAVLQVIGGLCYPIARYGLQQIDPFTFAFFRFILASVVLLSIVRIRRPKPAIERRDWWKIFGLAILIIPLNQMFFMIGQSLTGAGHGAFLFSTTPVFVFILAIIHLDERATWRRGIGIGLATTGVMIIMWSGLADVGPDYLWGDLIILGAVIAWGYYTVFGKPLVRKYGALRMTAYALAIGSAMYLPFGAIAAVKYDYSKADWIAWSSVVYMAIGLSVVVYVLWYWLIKHLEASRVAVYHNVQPIIASTVAFLFLNEPLSAAFLLGGAIVIVGVVITETHRTHGPRPGLLPDRSVSNVEQDSRHEAEDHQGQPGTETPR